MFSTLELLQNDSECVLKHLFRSKGGGANLPKNINHKSAKTLKNRQH